MEFIMLGVATVAAVIGYFVGLSKKISIIKTVPIKEYRSISEECNELRQRIWEISNLPEALKDAGHSGVKLYYDHRIDKWSAEWPVHCGFKIKCSDNASLAVNLALEEIGDVNGQ